MGKKGPKIKLKIYCTDCEHLKYQPRAVCADDPVCKELNMFLEEEYISGSYLPVTKEECPYKKDALREFYLQQITPRNNGTTILKLIRGNK